MWNMLIYRHQILRLLSRTQNQEMRLQSTDIQMFWANSIFLDILFLWQKPKSTNYLLLVVKTPTTSNILSIRRSSTAKHLFMFICALNRHPRLWSVKHFTAFPWGCSSQNTSLDVFRNELGVNAPPRAVTSHHSSSKLGKALSRTPSRFSRGGTGSSIRVT